MTSAPFSHIGIAGAGAFGTALALVAARAGRPAVLWARRPEAAQAINRQRKNPAYLNTVDVPDSITATGDLGTLAKCDLILLAVPTQSLRRVCEGLAKLTPQDVPLVLCAKGIEQGSLALPLQIAAEVAPGHPPAVLSGPGFASEIAEGRPTAVTLAAEDLNLAGQIAQTIGHASFRPYVSNDPLGAEIGGAVKNVLAIACGISDGRGLGDSTRAALITRCFAEMARFGRALGAQLETLTGLSGLGDLVLTCTSPQSRNYRLGKAIGEGTAPAQAIAALGNLFEGAATAPALVTLAERNGVSMPIADCVNAILQDLITVDKALEQLLARPFGAEGVGL